jgi:hypothetical protein
VVPSAWLRTGVTASCTGRLAQEVNEMIERLAPPGHGEIGTLILQALVRKLVAKNVLSQGDVRDLLFDAATRLNVVGSEQTPQAARTIVEEDLAPVFLGEDACR